MNPAQRKVLADYFAARYGDRSTEREPASAAIRGRLFRDWAGTGKRILDVGCGSGTVTRYVKDGNNVTGVDVDRQALEACQARYGVRGVWADFAAELPFEPASFDVVIAGETIEHLPYPTIFLGEALRVLVPEGLFLGSVPNAYRYQNRINVLLGKPFDRDPTHLHHFSLASLRALLSRQLVVELIVPVRGKYSAVFPSWFAHYFAWRCRKPRA
jgi:SAM-dependent methyltransferase